MVLLAFVTKNMLIGVGPDGGDGGNGGKVIFQASRNENTLVAFRHNRSLEAEAGQSGSKRKKHVDLGKHLIIQVPIGAVH